jgi:short subunit dehydrogenase-like uncharacterized protein
MQRAGRIVVIGATGYTGSLVARELARGDTAFLLTGRNPERLARLAREAGGAETRVVDVTRPASLEGVLRAGDAVINCAGPFTDLGEPVVAACIRAGAHYLDTTGEQRFMKRVFDRYHDAAGEAGVAVVNAMAFEYAIGDCAAALAAQDLATPLRSLDLVYAWRGGAAASSRGTRLSVLRVIREGGFVYRDGRWQPQRTGAARRTLRLGGRTRTAVSFPAGEILTVPRHVEVRTVRGWMVTGRWNAAAVPVLSPILPPLVKLADPLAGWLLQRAPEGPTPEQRRQTGFQIRAEAVAADGEQRNVTARGQDPYGLTARIAVRGAEHILQQKQLPGGVLAPAQVLHSTPFRNLLESWGITWQEDHKPSY